MYELNSNVLKKLQSVNQKLNCFCFREARQCIYDVLLWRDRVNTVAMVRLKLFPFELMSYLLL
jgi:hypothetical protein